MPQRNETHMDVIYQTGSNNKSPMSKEERKGRDSAAIRTMAPSMNEYSEAASPTRQSKSRANTVKFGKINQVIDYSSKPALDKKVSYNQIQQNYKENDFEPKRMHSETGQMDNYRQHQSLGKDYEFLSEEEKIEQQQKSKVFNLMLKKDEYIFATDPGKAASKINREMMRSMLEENVDDGKSKLKQLEQEEVKRSMKLQRQESGANFDEVKGNKVSCCFKLCFKSRSKFQNMTTS